jgi:hypothetical protein
MKNRHSDLEQQFSWLFNGTLLDSAEANESKSRYIENLIDGNKSDEVPLVPSPRERVSDLLQKSADGASAAWVEMTMWLSMPADATSNSEVGDNLNADVTSYPGWIESTATQRESIVRSAHNFLVDESINASGHVPSLVENLGDPHQG